MKRGAKTKHIPTKIAEPRLMLTNVFSHRNEIKGRGGKLTRDISLLRLLFMSQLLVAVFVTSDRHNLLISEDVSAVAKLGVSPTVMGKCETAETQFLLAVLSLASFRPQKMKHKQ